MLITIIIALVLITITATIIISKKKKNDKTSIENVNEVLKVTENSVKVEKDNVNIIAYDFKINGKKDEYYISFKENRIQFLVKNGKIVAFKNENTSRLQYFNGGEEQC